LCDPAIEIAVCEEAVRPDGVECHQHGDEHAERCPDPACWALRFKHSA